MKKMVMLLGIFGGIVVVAGVYALLTAKEAISPSIGTTQIGDAIFTVEVVYMPIAQMRGLSGRQSLAQDHGMLFVFGSKENHGFVMRGMQFPIDMVWIADGEVRGITENIPISSKEVYYPPKPVDVVLEIPAGTAAAHHIKEGDRVTYK
ncbi:MAG: DUF192 domain-containing protein [bacterium]|nr:DUF192 domain-containing protein [bacterium]